MIENIRSLVRPFMAISFVAMTGFCVYKGEITGKDILQLMGIVMVFYFNERSIMKAIDKTKKGE